MSWRWLGQMSGSSSCAPPVPVQPGMDSLPSSSSVSLSTAALVAGDGAANFLPPLTVAMRGGFGHFPVGSGGLVERAVRPSSCSITAGNGTVSAGAFAVATLNNHIAGTDHANASTVLAVSANETECSKDANGEVIRPPPATATGKSKGKGAKDAGEPQKEGYSHVRARKGQATNSHSIEERLRREKISERMKLLQDLVPGCSKVTGKALMLDEIINYVQSLQRQVEFLSIKLSAVNPRIDVDIESLVSKDVLCFPEPPSSAPMGFSFSPEIMPGLQFLRPLLGGVHGTINPDVITSVMQKQQQNDKGAFGDSDASDVGWFIP